MTWQEQGPDNCHERPDKKKVGWALLQKDVWAFDWEGGTICSQAQIGVSPCFDMCCTPVSQTNTLSEIIQLGQAESSGKWLLEIRVARKVLSSRLLHIERAPQRTASRFGLDQAQGIPSTRGERSRGRTNCYAAPISVSPVGG